MRVGKRPGFQVALLKSPLKQPDAGGNAAKTTPQPQRPSSSSSSSDSSSSGSSSESSDCGKDEPEVSSVAPSAKEALSGDDKETRVDPEAASPAVTAAPAPEATSPAAETEGLPMRDEPVDSVPGPPESLHGPDTEQAVENKEDVKAEISVLAPTLPSEADSPDKDVLKDIKEPVEVTNECALPKISTSASTGARNEEGSCTDEGIPGAKAEKKEVNKKRPSKASEDEPHEKKRRGRPPKGDKSSKEKNDEDAGMQTDGKATDENRDSITKEPKKVAKKDAKPRGRSAYAIFCVDKREEVRSANPGMGSGDAFKALGELWKKASESEKQKYKDLAAAEKADVIAQTSAQPTAGQPTAGQPTAGQPTAGQPTSGQPTSGQPTAGKPTAGQPTSGQPTAGQPTAGQPTAGQPAAGAASPPTASTSVVSSTPICSSLDKATVAHAATESYESYCAINWRRVENGLGEGASFQDISVQLKKEWKMATGGSPAVMKPANNQAKAKGAKSNRASSAPRLTKAKPTEKERNLDAVCAALEVDEDTNIESVLAQARDGSYIVKLRGEGYTQLESMDYPIDSSGNCSDAPLALGIKAFRDRERTFRKELESRTEDGTLDLDDLEEGSPLEVLAFLGNMREDVLAAPGSKLPEPDVWMRVPMLGLCQIIQGMLDTERSTQAQLRRELEAAELALKTMGASSVAKRNEE